MGASERVQARAVALGVRRLDGSTIVRAVVFDLDGVLIDSEPVWERVRRSYVAEHGGTWARDAQQRLMGMSTPEWATYLSEELGVDEEPDQVEREVIAEMADTYEQRLCRCSRVPTMPSAASPAVAAGPGELVTARLIDRVLELTDWAALFRPPGRPRRGGSREAGAGRVRGGGSRSRPGARSMRAASRTRATASCRRQPRPACHRDSRGRSTRRPSAPGRPPR